MRDQVVEDSELTAARDFLVGVFPLRFETAGAVVGALSGLAIHGLPLDELIGYRGRIEAVDSAAVAAAARTHLHVAESSIVLVGDADAFGTELEAAGLGPVTVERDEVPAAGPAPDADIAVPGPVDRQDEEGPRAGAEEPELPGAPDEPSADDR